MNSPGVAAGEAAAGVNAAAVAPGPEPVISVCVPTYNGRGHLAACLDSLLAQEFTDFEVIVVDDDSQDGTWEEASGYAARDGRFRVHRNGDRLGLVANWNRCVELARGEWIKFLFQDDLLKPACLARLLGACRQQDKRFGFCAREFVFEAGTAPKLIEWFGAHARRLREEYAGAPAISPVQAARLMAGEPALNLAGEPTVTLIHRSLFRELGGFDAGLIQLCDAEFWDRILIHHGGVFVAEELAAFRLHAKAATALNHERRRFRMGVLDRLVLQHRFAFGGQYGALRARAGAWRLRKECVLLAGRAWLEMDRRRRAGDRSLWEEWQAVQPHCPGLWLLAWLGRLLGTLRGLKPPAAEPPAGAGPVP